MKSANPTGRWLAVGLCRRATDRPKIGSISAPASGQATEKPGTVRERLIALKELLELGLIFPEEFEQKRADILQELTDGPL